MVRVNVATYWEKIEQWLSQHAPAAMASLPPGVSSSALVAAEDTLNFAIPADVKDFLSVHDGSGGLWLHDRGEFMSLETIVSSWDNEFDLWGDGNNDKWATPIGPIRKKWFNREWLPVLDARTGDYVCIDLDPPRGGKRGQLMTWSHDGGPQQVIAESYATLLSDFVAELAEGRYTPKLNQAGQCFLEYRES